MRAFHWWEMLELRFSKDNVFAKRNDNATGAGGIARRRHGA
jgi:hypothetical protein